MRITTFDIEIEKTPDEVGGWDNVRKGDAGVSAVITIDDPGKVIRLWDKHTLHPLYDHLMAADLLVSFNGIRFDLPVIEGVLGSVHPHPDHYDILTEIWKAIGGKDYSKCWGLDAMAKGTLGSGKSGHGAVAPILAQAGHWAALFNYCMDDVLLTRGLWMKIADGLPLKSTENGQQLLLRLPENLAEIRMCMGLEHPGADGL